MKKALLSVALIAVSTALAGCQSTVSERAENLGRVMNKGVDMYCKLPEPARYIVRDKANDKSSGHEIVVRCAGDL